jgi:hypothetical protein
MAKKANNKKFNNKKLNNKKIDNEILESFFKYQASSQSSFLLRRYEDHQAFSFSDYQFLPKYYRAYLNRASYRASNVIEKSFLNSKLQLENILSK